MCIAGVTGSPADAGARRQAVAAGRAHGANDQRSGAVLHLCAAAHAQVQGQEVVPAVNAPTSTLAVDRALGNVFHAGTT